MHFSKFYRRNKKLSYLFAFGYIRVRFRLKAYFKFRLKWNICVVPVAYLPFFSNPTLNIKMVFGEKIPKMGTFSDFATIFFVKCFNKI